MEKGLKTQDRRALLQQVAPEYHHASASQNLLFLEGFVTSTGCARKYTAWLLNHPQEVLPTTNVSRHRYRPEVEHALVLAWKTLNRICVKRLIPSLPTSLEQFSYLQLGEEHRNRYCQLGKNGRGNRCKFYMKAGH